MANTQQSLKPGAMLRHETYRIERMLGQGGFGITYLATDLNLDRVVAIKEFFPKDYCDRESSTSHVTLGTQSASEFVNKLKTKFLKEARNIAKFDHPGIIKIHAAFEENNTAYYVMDYIEGESLSEMVKRHGPLTESKALEYIKKVGKALEYVHSKKINHLDIKPANIMVRRSDDNPILIDFGLSKQYDSSGNQTSTTPVGISHGYAPIEQYNDGGVKEFSPQTDLYLLAATLYYLLSGVVPPQATRLVNEELTFPSLIPSRFIDSISKAMSIGRKKRHESISEFIEEINDATQIKEEGIQNEETTINETSFHNFPQNGENDNIFHGTNEFAKKSDKQQKWILPIVVGIVAVVAILCLLSLLSNDKQQNQTESEIITLVRSENRVSDINDYLTVEQKESLNNINDSVSHVSDLQIVSMIVKDSKTQEFKLYNDSVFNSWGIGDSIKNNGILIGIDVNNKQIAVSIGSGISDPIWKKRFWQTVVDSVQYYCKKADYFNALKIGTLMSGKYDDFRQTKNNSLSNHEQNDDTPIKPNNDIDKENQKELPEENERQERLNKAIKDEVLGAGQIMRLAEYDHYVPAYLYHAKNLLRKGETKKAREFLKKSVIANVNVSQCEDLLEILNE